MPYGSENLGQPGSGNGLEPSGNKPLPEPDLLSIRSTGPTTFIGGQFH